MPTSCNTHDYDGKLREKWFQMRSMLIEKYLPNCLSFDDTIKEMEGWIDKKYNNAKRNGRARRSIKILTSQRSSNFDSRNDIDVEELLPILWDKVKNQEDIHNTFYEQLCDITGGSCSQGRSTRLFQFLFLFDLPVETSKTEEEEKKPEIATKQEQDSSETILDKNTVSISEVKQQPQEEEQQQLQKDQLSHVEEKTEGEQQSQDNKKVEDMSQTNSSSENTK